jgi:hypothetical protein
MMAWVTGDWQDFDVAIARWKLGELAAEEIPAAAVEALSVGCDTPSLGLLAAMDGSGWSEIESVVDRVLADRGRSAPTGKDAVKVIADALLQELVSERVDPEAATERLRRLAWKTDDGHPLTDLLPFAALSDNWERSEAGEFDRAEVREVTLDNARRLLAQGGIRLVRS